MTAGFPTGFSTTLLWSLDVIPPGTILLWYGALDNVPEGFQLCDGTNGTPDCLDKFVYCAGNLTVPGQTGGLFNHQHIFTGNGHKHSATHTVKTDGTGTVSAWKGAGPGSDSTSTNVHGTTDMSTSFPPWIALGYIMKMA